MIDDIIREYFQNQRINRTRSRLDDERYSNENLRGEVERLHLVVEAMWELLKNETSLTDDQLIVEMNEVDLEDGKLDGKASLRGVDECKGCGKILQKGSATCMYCGLAHRVSPFKNR
jgi:hypothetical protein